MNNKQQIDSFEEELLSWNNLSKIRETLLNRKIRGPVPVTRWAMNNQLRALDQRAKTSQAEAIPSPNPTGAKLAKPSDPATLPHHNP